MPNGKNVSNNNVQIDYLNRDFSTLRKALVDYAKVYFPNTYRDFNEEEIL